MKKGYSIIELLVVLGILGIIVVVASTVILNTIRGAARVSSDAQIRQDLNYALSVMERSLRNAKSVACESESKVNYVDQNNVSASFFQGSDFTGSAETGYQEIGFVASASADASLTGPSVNILSTTFVCTPAVGNTPPSVMITISGVDAIQSGVEQGRDTVSTTVYLRSSL